MHQVPDHEYAPKFDVYYDIPGYKAAPDSGEVFDGMTPADHGTDRPQAEAVTTSPTTRQRHAGAVYAWTAEEAIRELRAIGCIPTSAVRVWAEQQPSEHEPRAIQIKQVGQRGPRRGRTALYITAEGEAALADAARRNAG